jgi:flagellar basal body-associated protein FliL
MEPAPRSPLRKTAPPPVTPIAAARKRPRSAAAAAAPAPKPTTDRNTVAAWIFGGLLAMLLLSWAGVKTVSSFLDDNARPRPVWVEIKPVQAQMLDGRMVGVKVTLQLGDGTDGADIESYKPAIAAVIQQIGAGQTKESLYGKDGMAKFSQQLRESVNDYLEDHEMGRAVNRVNFNELIVMPVGEIH